MQPSPVEAAPAPEPAEAEAPPLNDAEFVSEELPPDFWDSEPAPPDERISKHLGADSFFDAAPSAAQPGPQKPAEAEQPQADSGGGKGRFGTPLFADLQSLFPGRVVKVETPEEDDAETEALLEPEEDADKSHSNV